MESSPALLRSQEKFVAGAMSNSAPPAFQRSSKVVRTPPGFGTPQEDATPQSFKSQKESNIPRQSGSTAEVEMEELDVSPRQSSIRELRQAEEIYLKQCLTLIQEMKPALARQKNIAGEVKFGLPKLEEALECALGRRRLWMEEEKSERESRKRADETILNPSQGGTRTPVTTKKRPPPSPEEHQDEKRMRDTREDWSTVVAKSTKKKEKKLAKTAKKTPAAPRKEASSEQLADKAVKARTRGRARRRPQSDALLVQPAEGKTYADVLGALRKAEKPENTEVRFRKTLKGQLLVELGGGVKSVNTLCETLRSALGAEAEVKSLEPKATIEIRDLDSLTSKEEVEDAIRRDLPNVGDFRVGLTKENTRGQKIAFVELGRHDAAKLLESGKIRVGWINARCKKREAIRRCFKCFGFGHVAGVCKGTDRSSTCFRCGETGHKKQSCKADESCALCKERGAADTKHTAGSGKCQIFREWVKGRKSAAD